MRKTRGNTRLPLVECINPRLGKYRVRWDMHPYIEDGEEGIEFMEEEFYHKPTIKEIKEVILSWKNSEIDKKILGGFMWDGMRVWLSPENQFNYKAAYDFAIHTNGANLPVTFKFGTIDEPNYYEFTSVEALGDFFLKAMAYINEQLVSGWKDKDSFDWSEYENYLK